MPATLIPFFTPLVLLLLFFFFALRHDFTPVLLFARRLFDMRAPPSFYFCQIFDRRPFCRHDAADALMLMPCLFRHRPSAFAARLAA